MAREIRKDLESQEKVREFENKWLLQAVFRKFILFKRGKDVLSLAQQNRALEAATVTLCYFTALCIPMGKRKKYSIFIFSQNQDSSRPFIAMSQK